ncbi:MAG: TlpA disulfide reductase family protein [Steroidobacteraceae bacterium]
MNKGVMIAVAVAVAAALGALAQRQLAAPTATPGPAAAVAQPDAEAAPPAETITPAPAKIPDALPQFKLADRDGKPRQLGDWKGRPLLVNYWATWCAPCRREIPLLNQLRIDRKAQKLEVIGIAVDFREDVLKYAQETTISYPLLIGEEDGLAAVQAMGMQSAFPFSVFADSQQRIVALKVGELHRDEAELILDRVAGVDAGTLPLAQARDEITEGLKELATRRATAKPASG